jgi:Mn-dependent DtxR family transcriptional regulator
MLKTVSWGLIIMVTVRNNMERILELLIKSSVKSLSGGQISSTLDLSPENVNDAVTLLEKEGLVATYKTLGTRPFIFSSISATPFGRDKYEENKEHH